MGFAARRLAVTAITLFLVSVITFAIFSVIPGDAASLILGTEATDEQLAALRAELGLDKNPARRYAAWLGGFFSGSMGNSVRFRGEPIEGLVKSRLPVTFSLAALSLAFTILIAAAFALPASKNENTPMAHIINTMAAAGVSVPNFFLGVLFIWLFGVVLKFFSPGAFVPASQSAAGFWKCLLFPALAIALPNSALLVKFLRTSIAVQFKSPYVRTARSKGADDSRILRRHVLKNALIPSVTALGMIIAEVFSGSIVIEQVFAIPGVGRLLITAISSRDYPLAQTLVLYIAFIVIAANSLADMAITVIDHRVKLS